MFRTRTEATDGNEGEAGRARCGQLAERAAVRGGPIQSGGSEARTREKGTHPTLIILELLMSAIMSSLQNNEDSFGVRAHCCCPVLPQEKQLDRVLVERMQLEKRAESSAKELQEATAALHRERTKASKRGAVYAERMAQLDAQIAALERSLKQTRSAFASQSHAHGQSILSTLFSPLHSTVYSTLFLPRTPSKQIHLLLSRV